ncbi:M24 family metallopeptidase [Bradyrhizobium diversitatis]|uniref:M24 family metallopeptidase n=1 Tax=Bradyrhizobium diversitatis TaxID=2755406 RepID=A0ABS0PFU3_9BRAD|nr:Xaa-Pro peptidase family protein [Bradyrhizobium diversitatis]MBH5392164.1 M24 family metallopeptidase [Bradyrhizobium diversitatis]
MEKILYFERTEFDSRLATTKHEMAKRGLDILLLSEPPNVNYLTGYDSYTFYTPQMLIVALNRSEPIYVTRLVDRPSAQIFTYLAEENIRGFPDFYVNSTTSSAWAFIADVVKEVGGETARIGVELGGYYYSARTHADLVKALPNAEFLDADLLVNWIRIVKSPAELTLMRQAGRIADAMLTRAVEMAEPGVRECDLAAAVYHQQHSGLPEFGGSYDSSIPYFCVGDRARGPHSAWTDRPLPDSTQINIEVHGNRLRYQVHVSRTICIGKPTPEYTKFAEIQIEGLNAALETVRPGRACSEVFAAFSKVLAKHGIVKTERIGYSQGIGYPPAGSERTVSIREDEQTVLQPGMCLHLMPGLWLDNGTRSVAVTQPLEITQTGYAPLTTTPRVLVVKK